LASSCTAFGLDPIAFLVMRAYLRERCMSARVVNLTSQKDE
jgi:hypothetical protein